MLSRLRSFLVTWTRRERFEDSLDEEVRFHLDAYAEDLVRSGVTRREAIRRARIHFGGVETIKDDCRQARGLRLADEIARATRHAGRFLRRNPGFALAAVATLGLSIGATVVVFSIIDAWLFRPLSFPEPDRLTISVYATRERPSEPAVFVLYRDYLSWKARSRSFESMSAVFPRTYLMGDVAEISTAEGLVVTGEFFRTLGVSPRLGRTFSHPDEAGAAVTVLSHGLWERRFGAAETVIGTSVTLNDVQHEVIGVMPPEFELGALPGVRRTAAATVPLLSAGAPVRVRTRTGDDEAALRVPVQDVTLGFFTILGIPLSAGRLFDVRDGPAAPPVAIVNESAARLLFGSPADALGRRLQVADDIWRDVAGVVGDTRSAFFNTLEWVTNPVIYLPARQGFDAIRDPTIRSFALHLQIESDAPLSLPDVRRAVADLSTLVAVTETRRAGDVIAAALRQPAFRMWLLGWFAFVSLVLAAIGVYGIVSQGIAHRTREIGIRLALGAAPGRVRAAVTSRTLLTVAVGATGGCAAAMILGTALEAVLYGVRPSDFVSFAASAAALLVVATGAAFAAASRATRISPVEVLRGS